MYLLIDSTVHSHTRLQWSTLSNLVFFFGTIFQHFFKVLDIFSSRLIRLTHGKMAETGKEEVDGGNEVNDPPEWGEDATKGMKNDGKQMESPVKEKSLRLMKTFRASFKAVSPMTLKNKRSENTDSDQSQISNSPLQPPSSPSKCIHNVMKKCCCFLVTMSSQGQSYKRKSRIYGTYRLL